MVSFKLAVVITITIGIVIVKIATIRPIDIVKVEMWVTYEVVFIFSFSILT